MAAGPLSLDGRDAKVNRLSADFDFWAVRPVNGSDAWVRIGTYTNGIITIYDLLASVYWGPPVFRVGGRFQPLYKVRPTRSFRTPECGRCTRSDCRAAVCKE